MKYSVLTFLMGYYDKLHELPKKCLSENIEYICVTDRKNLSSKTWKVYYDEDLDKSHLNGFDRSFYVRYNPFKYVSNDILIMVDASIIPLIDLSSLIKEFIDGDYLMGLSIHPERIEIKKELDVWAESRNYDDIQLQTNFIENKIGLNLEKKGLVQTGLRIIKRSKLTDEIHHEMLSILHECSINKHVNRLDQTLFSALLLKKYSNEKFMFLSSNVFSNGKFISFFHNSNRKISMKHDLNNYIWNDKEVNAYE